MCKVRESLRRDPDAATPELPLVRCHPSVNACSIPTASAEILRFTLAANEDLTRLRAVAVLVEELAQVTADSFLGDVADLCDRVHATLHRLGSPLPVRRASLPAQDGRMMAPAIKMRITPWSTDEKTGVLSRSIYNAADEPPL